MHLKVVQVWQTEGEGRQDCKCWSQQPLSIELTTIILINKDDGGGDAGDDEDGVDHLMTLLLSALMPT